MEGGKKNKEPFIIQQKVGQQRKKEKMDGKQKTQGGSRNKPKGIRCQNE